LREALADCAADDEGNKGDPRQDRRDEDVAGQKTLEYKGTRPWGL